MHIHDVRDFPQGKLDSEINARFLLNEHGVLHFLLHNFGVHVILFRLKKIVLKEKKISLKASTKPLLDDLENNDSGNVLSPCRLKLCEFAINDILICCTCSTLSAYLTVPLASRLLL